ncbi:hypothetical protein [Pseudonocardia sp. DLS-67]
MISSLLVAAAHEDWRHAHAVLADLDPSATDQIHTKLATIGKPAAHAFRRQRIGVARLAARKSVRPRPAIPSNDPTVR